MIDKNFWQDVEKNLKYVLYGDSVSENSKIVVKYKNKLNYISLYKIWDLLVDKHYKITIIGSKEYIFLDTNVEILSYDVNADRIITKNPRYIMRHWFKGRLCRINLTNEAHIDLTYNHSLVHIHKRKLIEILPEEAKYVAVCRNDLNCVNFKYDPLYLLYGMYLSNGAITSNINGYKTIQISFTNKEKAINFIEFIDGQNEIEIYEWEDNWSIGIKYKKLLNLLILNNYYKLKSPDRYITSEVFEDLKYDQNKFLSFIIGFYIGDGSYTSNVIAFSSASEKLIDQICELFMYYGIYSHKLRDNNGRKYKEKIKGNMFNLKCIGIPLSIINELKKIESIKNHKPIEEHGLFFGNSESKFNNGCIVRKKEFSSVVDAKPVKIMSKTDIDYDGYVYDFEVPDTHNFITNGIICKNTDSLFVHIPSIDSTKIEESIEKSSEVAENINNIIKNYLDTTLLPKLHVPSQHNFTEFKTEFTCNSIMFLDIKKNYAYRMTSKEGKICKPGEDVQYTGIPVVKTNTSEFSRELLTDLIQKIVLCPNLDKSTIMNNLNILAKEKYSNLNEQIKIGNFRYFATPVKWGDSEYTKDPSNVVGMRLYNTITQSEIFKPLSSGLQIPINIKNSTKVKELVSDNKFKINIRHLSILNYICLPYNYDSQEVFKLFNEYNIEIINNLWEKLLDASVIKKIIELVKDYAKK